MGKINQPSNLVDRIKRIERELSELRKRAGLGNAQISSGSLTVTDGTIIVENADGQDIVRTGKHVDGFGNPVTGVQIKRPDGSTSFWAYATEDGNGFASLWDESGNICVSTDAESGQGLATPYIPLTTVPTRLMAVPGESTTNTSFGGGLFTVNGVRQHPRLKVQIIATVPGGTTGEWRVKDVFNGGTIIAGPQSLGTGGFFGLTGPIGGGHMSIVQVDVEARVTSGPGPIRIEALYAQGVQS